jgi:heme-degrading monooxygenase HmoA
MSTIVTNEFHARKGRGTDVLRLLLQLAPESHRQPGCEAISIRRNQDDPDNVIGDTRWATRQHYDDYLAWRTENGFTASVRRHARRTDAHSILRRDPFRTITAGVRTRGREARSSSPSGWTVFDQLPLPQTTASGTHAYVPFWISLEPLTIAVLSRRSVLRQRAPIAE